MITIKEGVFHLSAGNYSYAFYEKDGRLVHSYFGNKLDISEERLATSLLALGRHDNIGRDWALSEYAQFGRGDFRIASVEITGNGFASTEFVLCGYEILKNKPSTDLPQLRNGGETLKLTLCDKISRLQLNLFYTPYEEGLVRSAQLVNNSGEDVNVCKFMSTCIDFPQGKYSTLNLNGRWGAECTPCLDKVTSGIRQFSSCRGVSSHQHNPFIAVTSSDTSEDNGEVVAMNLIFSGNFVAEYESDEKTQLRVNIGEKLMHGGIVLKDGDVLNSPETAIVYSNHGLGEMSRLFHKLYGKHLVNPRFANVPRPVVVNSWESFYFDFNEGKLLDFIDGAKGLGVDTIVLDDGWFGKRDDDTGSLGDWFIDANKLPNGLQPVIDRCRRNGFKFGIWFEPEAVNPDSRLYRNHPDWALHVKDVEGVTMRNQYMLDFSNPDVVDYIFDSMKLILDKYDISYVKWDSNRPLSDISDASKLFGYVRGVYRLYERLLERYPDLFIEGCSSGGGRFDAGILYYSPMIWTSDDTDAYERCRIQYGTSMCYPLETLSNHVSACPNHQTGRFTPLHTRGAVASMGSLGYELNVGLLSDDDKKQIAYQVENYRRDQHLIMNGDLYRLVSPFEDNAFCQMVVSQDKSKAYLVFLRALNTPNLPVPRVRLKGLDDKALYRIIERNTVVSGAELMNIGLNMQLKWEDFSAEILHIERCDG